MRPGVTNLSLMESIMQNFLTITETARLARVSERTIRRWMAQGRLKRYGVGKVLIDTTELENLLRGKVDHHAAT